MEPLAPDYLLAMAGQLGALSAFLGGFAATFLATLLTLGREGRLLTVSVALAAVSSVAFVVCVVAASMLAAVLHPHAPAAIAATPDGMPRAVMSLSFAAGMLALLMAIGASGWLRSRRIGWITGGIAAIGIVLIAALTIQVG